VRRPDGSIVKPEDLRVRPSSPPPSPPAAIPTSGRPSTSAVPVYGRSRQAAAPPSANGSGAAGPSAPATERGLGDEVDEVDEVDDVVVRVRSEEAASPSESDGSEGDDGDEPVLAAVDPADSPDPAEGDPPADETGERKAYQFGDGPAPVHTGDQPAVASVVRPIRTAQAEKEATPAKSDGKDASNDDPAVRPATPLRIVHDLSLDRLLGADPETREARNAKLRRAGTGVGAVALAGVLIYAVFPVRTYLDQRAATDRAREQIEMLDQENDRLEDRAESLGRDEEIERLAREDYGMVRPGEESYGVMPPPETTTTSTTSTTTPPTPPPAG
jgi:cell division protein FtsB